LDRGCNDCRGRSLGFDGALAFGRYEDTIRNLCLRLKAERNAWLAPWLSELLADAYRHQLTKLPGETWIVPIPLHWMRWLERGYNQAEALARGLSKLLALPLHQPLWRIKAGDHLAHYSASSRFEAMQQAFRARADPDLKGRTILLVDDVLTTGATCGAAARALKKAGARRVVVATIARAL
jgi:ComF family protein